MRTEPVKSARATAARATAVSAVLLLVSVRAIPMSIGMSAVLLLAPLARNVLAADPPPDTLVREANEALQHGEFDKALELYDQAGNQLPDSPELAFNKAVAHYRKGEYDKAKELFSAARRMTDPNLDAKAKFNLGNCAYAGALAKRANTQEAVAELQSAIVHYKDAIEADPMDRDARTNIEMAQLLMKDLLDRQNQKQKQQQEQQNQEKKDEQRDQPQENDSQDNEQSEQQQEQPQEGEKPQEEEQQNGEQKPQEQPAGQEQQQAEPQPQEGNEQQDPQQAQSASEGAAKQQPAKPGEQRQLSREEAQRLLQLVRDKELQRRQELTKRTRAKLVPVERDW